MIWKFFKKVSKERPKWFVKYWQLEQERADLNIDPFKNESNPESKTYREWIQNELNEALIGQQIYLSPESFVGTAEGILLNTVLSVHELSLKSRSQEVEVQEFKIIKDFLDRFPISDNQKIRYLYIDMYRETWGEFTKFQEHNNNAEVYDFQFNIFGNVPSERKKRLELAIDEIKSSIENQQNNWAKERISIYKQLYSLTKKGMAWFDSIGFRQAVGKPWEFLAARELGASVSQSSEIYACLAEIGHVYFQDHPFSITDHPELKWDDGNNHDLRHDYQPDYNKNKDPSNISSAYNQFRKDIDTFVILKDAGDAEPLRRWLASWPDYHMAEMAIPVTVTGGNIGLLKNTPFEKYFDQFLTSGEFNSYGEVASWYRTLSIENRAFFAKYFEPTLLPYIEEVARERPSFLEEIIPARKAYLDSIFAGKKSLVEHEEKQSLVDFGDQFHLYIDNNQLIDINPLYKSIWTDYINRIKLFYMKYPNLLRESHPSAYNFLQRSVKKTT